MLARICSSADAAFGEQPSRVLIEGVQRIISPTEHCDPRRGSLFIARAVCRVDHPHDKGRAKSAALCAGCGCPHRHERSFRSARAASVLFLNADIQRYDRNRPRRTEKRTLVS